MGRYLVAFFFFFFNDTATTEIYTLSLHDALPISEIFFDVDSFDDELKRLDCAALMNLFRSEEHTSELQSHSDLVCRLLLEKKKNNGTGTSCRCTPLSRRSLQRDAPPP